MRSFTMCWPQQLVCRKSNREEEPPSYITYIRTLNFDNSTSWLLAGWHGADPRMRRMQKAAACCFLSFPCGRRRTRLSFRCLSVANTRSASVRNTDRNGFYCRATRAHAENAHEIRALRSINQFYWRVNSFGRISRKEIQRQINCEVCLGAELFGALNS